MFLWQDSSSLFYLVNVIVNNNLPTCQLVISNPTVDNWFWAGRGRYKRVRIRFNMYHLS